MWHLHPTASQAGTSSGSWEAEVAVVADEPGIPRAATRTPPPPPHPEKNKGASAAPITPGTKPEQTTPPGPTASSCHLLQHLWAPLPQEAAIQRDETIWLCSGSLNVFRTGSTLHCRRFCGCRHRLQPGQRSHMTYKMNSSPVLQDFHRPASGEDASSQGQANI